MEKSMEKIVALAKSRGFVYPGSEIYGMYVFPVTTRYITG